MLTLCETITITSRGSSGSPGLDRAHDHWACSAGTRLARAHFIEEADMAKSGSQERAKGASKQAQGRLKEAIGAVTGNRHTVVVATCSGPGVDA